MTTAEEQQGLEVARYLIECDIPVFVAEQAKDGWGEWDPAGGTGHCGYVLPYKWQETKADESVLDRWKPGMALAAVMGHTVDGLDVDPRSGGLDSYKRLVAEGHYPASYGHQQTPSGGFHDLIAAMGVGSKDSLRPGLDVKGGRPEGHPEGTGRGFLFIAPTLKRSKVDGAIRPYRWTVGPDLTDIGEGLVDETGATVHDMIVQTRPKVQTQQPTDPFSNPDHPRPNPHEGPIVAGARDSSLLTYARLLRGKGLGIGEAKLLMEARWKECEQPQGQFYPLTFALAKVDSAFAKFQPNAEEVGADDAPTPTDEERAVAAELSRLRVQKMARRALAAEEAAEQVEDFDALFLDGDQLAAAIIPPALIDGVLPCGQNAILRGRDQTFKTFVALDWALCVATGRPWQGKPTQRGKVLYIAGEGASGINVRKQAWEEENGVRVAPDHFVVRKAALNMHSPGPAYEHLLAHVEDAGYSLVFIDTLRRVSGAADANGSDMGAVVDNIDRLKLATNGGSTVVLAHTDKGDKDTRGFSGVEDDIDVVWHAKREENTMQIVLQHTKMKDGPELGPMTLDVVEVGQSLILRAALRPATGVSYEWQILTALAETDAVTMTRAELEKWTDIPKATLVRHLKALAEKGRIIRGGTDARPTYSRA